MRPLFFAKETRENICDLLVETFQRLATAATETLQSTVTAGMLWKKINNIMSDAASKNLAIIPLISLKLQVCHTPHHILCKAHTVEALDRSNLNVLADVEKKLQLRETLISINPHLRSFYRGKSTVVVCGIYALLKLVTPDHCANSVSLADEFDIIVERKGGMKRMSLYHERRFTKLGYAAASIVNAFDLLKQLVTETSANNLLVQACKLYLESETFLTELKVLAFFTHKVTMPLLNCVACGT